MLTLDDTIGGENSNSYCDVSFVDDYWYSHFSTTKKAQWDALDDDQKQQLMIQGTRILERVRFTTPYVDDSVTDMIYDYLSQKVVAYSDSELPCKYYSYQALQFPRNIDVDSAGALFIPEAIKLALCEESLFLINYDEGAQQKALSGVKSESVGIGRGQIQKSTTYSDIGDALALAPLAWEFVSPFALKQTISFKRA